MGKGVVFLLVLVLITAPFIIVIKPAGASEVSWTSKEPMQQARGRLGVAAVNGKIYAIGGVTDPQSWGQTVGTNEEYDPTTDTWTFKEPMPTPRGAFGITVYQNKIYVIGGFASIDNAQYVLSGANEVYDPATDTWKTKASSPTPRYSISANVVDGKIYVIGGNSSENLVYDPATDSWTTKAPMPVTPYLIGWSCTSAVVDNKIHVIGIHLVSGLPNAFHRVYDPKTDRWSSGAPVPSEGHAYASAAATTGLNAPKRIYVFGVSHLYWELGLPGFATLAYDAESDSWTAGSSMPTPRINVGVAVVNDIIYAIGGQIVGYAQTTGASAVNEQYTPIGYYGPIDTTVPRIAVLSPENKTYYTTDVPLSFTEDEAVSWVRYSLDAQDTVTIAGNTTLTGLSYGSHNLTVYAQDIAGNIGASVTIYFTIAKESETRPEPETFPITWLAAAAV
ncbi:hypothetical protein MUO79_08635, partial [Candidatus Bathyarchaeota archaeon]|nr:hypothetical protein [Candidatus Bathyarchaeota archaeon]